MFSKPSPAEQQHAQHEHELHQSRRHFFRECGLGLGGMALSSLLAKDLRANVTLPTAARPPHFAPKAKAVIFLFMAGGPSQLELFEPKPMLNKLNGEVTPKSYTEGERFAFLKPDAKLLGCSRSYGRYGESGTALSELIPHHRKIVDDICVLHGMQTDVFNHGPAKVFVNTGSPQFGRPSMGSWVSYGIGSESDNLPAFVVLQSGPRGPRGGASNWTNGFLPSVHQGVPFLKGSAPILDLATPKPLTDDQQRDFIDAVREMNALRFDAVGDPEIKTRIAAYEMAYRMQSSAPELVDVSGETAETLKLYGAEPGKPSFATNCLLARRMVERGVRFVQLYHTNWDHHGGPTEDLGEDLNAICKEVDQPSAALVQDLKRHGLLDDTLVIWGGEFGRTPMGEERDFSTGRDHHINAYSMWMAGGGVKPGMTYGKTDEIGYNVIENPVHVHDLQATILNQLGLDHTKLTFRFQGRDFRLTDVHGHVVEDILE